MTLLIAVWKYIFCFWISNGYHSSDLDHLTHDIRTRIQSEHRVIFVTNGKIPEYLFEYLDIRMN